MRIVLQYIREGRNYIITLIICLLITLWGLYYVGSPMGEDVKAVLVVVPKGSTAYSTGKILKEHNLIRSAWAFSIIARVTEQADKIKPGAYKFSGKMSLQGMLDALVRGDVAAVWVTIPEGYTIEQIASKLADKGLVDKQEFIALASADAKGFSEILSIPTTGLEGYLFPDTYLVPLKTDARETITEMLKTFKTKVADQFSSEIAKIADGNTPGAKAEALHRILIVASMIEREARVPEDRPLVSAVIWNRLRRDMKLEIDATVQYALGNHRSRLYYRDLTVDSPYNTYRYAGLPPGPISNPGVASIKAALSPKKVSYLYYVARQDGSHVFSNTYDEHIAAKQRIRNGGR